MGLSTFPPKGCSDAVGNSTQLTAMSFVGNGMKEVPLEIGYFRHLKSLNLRGNKLTSLPDSFRSCEALTYLDVSHNEFVQFPAAICKLASVTILNFAHCKLSGLHDNIAGELLPPPAHSSVSTACARGKNLELISASVSNNCAGMLALENLIINHNAIIDLPTSLSKMPSIIHIDVRYNKLSELRGFAGSFNLQVLTSCAFPSKSKILWHILTLSLAPTPPHTVTHLVQAICCICASLLRLFFPLNSSPRRYRLWTRVTTTS